MKPSFRLLALCAPMFLLPATAVLSAQTATTLQGGSTEVQSMDYDVVIYGGSTAGISCAIRSAREGLRVLLVHYHPHLGGMMTNGLGTFDTVYEGQRSPIFHELHRRIMDYYRGKYGENSRQYAASRWGSRSDSSARPCYEAHVAEAIIEEMIAAEKSLTVLRGYYPATVERRGRMVIGVKFASMGSEANVRVAAKVFVDASYEGDLMAASGAEYTVGREARSKYGEPHAGRIFSRLILSPDGAGVYPTAAREGKLDLRPYRGTTAEIFAGSTGEGDAAVQAYNFRAIFTRDPANRVTIQKPERYERDLILRTRERWTIGGRIQNQKSNWNSNLIVGGNDAYPDGDWKVRNAIIQRHRDLTLAMLWFFQNDETTPATLREEAKHWGLTKDEFTDNGGLPWELYQRESRRLVGRKVFVEQTATLGAGLDRAPIVSDAIAFTEWPMDSHDCKYESMPGSGHEGKFLLSEETRPGQIPFDSLLPKDIDNLIVPTCLSASHVGWGTIRLEPVFLQTGEVAAFAAALSIKLNTPPGKIAPERLQRILVSAGNTISFFNNNATWPETSWGRATQFFCTRGFFASYDARPEEPLTVAMAKHWVEALLRVGQADDVNQRAQQIAPLEKETAPVVTAAAFRTLLEAVFALHGRDTSTIEPTFALVRDRMSETLRRGDACQILFELLPKD